uniref:Coat protein n=1 Tax=Mushroom bacilliform virus TaxID=32625 RepID=A0A1Q1M985_9VIRU|nr:coat protein [Mushroom bacilliform virus]
MANRRQSRRRGNQNRNSATVRRAPPNRATQSSSGKVKFVKWIAASPTKLIPHIGENETSYGVLFDITGTTFPELSSLMSRHSRYRVLSLGARIVPYDPNCLGAHSVKVFAESVYDSSATPTIPSIHYLQSNGCRVVPANKQLSSPPSSDVNKYYEICSDDAVIGRIMYAWNGPGLSTARVGFCSFEVYADLEFDGIRE